MESNVLIEASAGTGKTQALAERLIALLRAGVKPQEIVALTFSRAAAGEIFERFVSLLAKSVEERPEDLPLLREVIATQHLSQIGTLDGFLLRIVRSFPVELGLGGELAIMDDYEAGAERARVSFGILRRTDDAAKKAFVSAFLRANNHANERSFSTSYQDFVKNWHETYRSFPIESAWGDPKTFWPDGIPAWYYADEAALNAAADGIVGLVAHEAWPDFVAWVRNFRGKFKAPNGKDSMTGFAAKVFSSEAKITASEVSFKYRTQYALAGEDAARLYAAVQTVCGYALRQNIEQARGIFVLMAAYEQAYDRAVRRAGRLVFNDIPRLIASLPDDARLALEYRMDLKIRAWALDEFQDTSRAQWHALENLLEEAKQSNCETSVFVVGDRKQAIYGWRAGDVRIFERERESGAYALKALNASWRFGQAVTDAVNAVFCGGRIHAEFPAWESPKHETMRPELGGFVQCVEASSRKKEDFVEPVFNALAAVDPVARGLSAAVLVRTNDMGELLVTGLRRRGLKSVTWEGDSEILDTPALIGFLDLVALADHPGDEQAYRHFCTTPLCRAKYPQGAPDAADISATFALSFTARGLVRTFRDLRALLPADPDAAWSRSTEERFTDMLRAAAEFERLRRPGTRLADFTAFLGSQKRRALAASGEIRIMTIHRSKGLGFDYVVLPLYEARGLRAGSDGLLVSENWVLPQCTQPLPDILPELTPAAAKRRSFAEQEALCTYYVAMTRAKRAMTIVLPPVGKSSDALRFSDIVRDSIRNPIGNPAWYRDIQPDTGAATGAGAGGDQNTDSDTMMPPPTRTKRAVVRRRMPSKSLRSGMSAGDLFAPQPRRDEALRRGTEAHAAWERIAWLDPAEAQTPFARAFVKPSEDAEVWRERAYELFDDGAWESGQFDRVVFTGSGAARRATIYDFKTNRLRPGETAEAFAQRMRETYAHQLTCYREALTKLTGIPRERIAAKLLLAETQSVADIA